MLCCPISKEVNEGLPVNEVVVTPVKSEEKKQIVAPVLECAKERHKMDVTHPYNPLLQANCALILTFLKMLPESCHLKIVQRTLEHFLELAKALEKKGVVLEGEETIYFITSCLEVFVRAVEERVENPIYKCLLSLIGNFLHFRSSKENEKTPFNLGNALLTVLSDDKLMGFIRSGKQQVKTTKPSSNLPSTPIPEMCKKESESGPAMCSMAKV